MSIESNVPEIRFEGFSGTWEEKELGAICSDTYGGGTPKTSEAQYWNGDTPWIQSSDLVDQQLTGVVPKKWVTEKGLKSSATKLVPENSIAIVTRVGVGKLAFFPFKYAASQDFLSLSKLKVDHRFATYSIWKKLQSELHAVQGTSIKGITKEELLEKLITLPAQFSEQTKIGNYFQQLDTLIAQHQDKHDKLLQIKKSLLEKMFPKQGEAKPEIRFKGFSEPWEERALGEIYNFQYGQFNVNPSDEGIYSVYGANGIIGGYSNFNADNSIVIGHMGEYAGSVLWGEGKHFVTYNGTITTPKSTIIYPQFGYYMLHKLNIRKICGGSGQPFLSYETLQKIVSVFPASSIEQTKIANHFKNLDTLLNQHQSQLKKLKQIKQACLAKMFV